MTEFAYGKDEIVDLLDSDGCKCPATAAGFEPGLMTLVVEEYDYILSLENDESSGVVPEERAKEVWLEAIENTDYGGQSVQMANKVAKELGWLDV